MLKRPAMRRPAAAGAAFGETMGHVPAEAQVALPSASAVTPAETTSGSKTFALMPYKSKGHCVVVAVQDGKRKQVRGSPKPTVHVFFGCSNIF